MKDLYKINMRLKFHLKLFSFFEILYMQMGINNQSEQASTKPSWTEILLLMSWPPAALAHFAKEKQYNHFLPMTLWFYAAANIFFIFVYYIGFYSNLKKFTQELGAVEGQDFTTLLIFVALAFAFIEIIIGFLIKQKINSNSEIPKSLVQTTIVIYIANIASLGLLVMASIFRLQSNLYNQFTQPQVPNYQQ